MGVRNLAGIAERLMAAGRAADEPVAVVERGTLPDQRAVTGTLADIARRVSEAGLKPPAITLVGPVARLREELRWLERRPLFGRTVVVTRARAQASGLAARLAALGAHVVEAPAIRIEPRPPAEVDPVVGRIADYPFVIVTSPNGATLLAQSLERNGLDARALAGAAVAAIGPGTAAELRRSGVRADVVPPRSIAESLVEALAELPVTGKRVLVARAAEARDVLPEALVERGAEVEILPLYDTVAEPPGEPLGAADYVTFTSSSTVRFFLENASIPNGARVVSIGPVTSETARGLGLQVDVEAKQHDVDGLVDALVADATR